MIATYRLQLSPELDFDAVCGLVDYFAQLGISHLYLSPITEAHEGSSHGYDVVDHNRVRQELGGDRGLDRLREACVRAGLALIIDFVPNHAGVGPHNPAWQDMLAYGPDSPYAPGFDVDWRSPKPELEQRLLLPFLGTHYGEALDSGDIRLVWERGALWAAYFEDRFAISPATWGPVLDAAARACADPQRAGELAQLAQLAGDARGRASGRALAARAGHAIDDAGVDLATILSEVRGDRLHALLERQSWRLSYWKTAGDEINYRRFFDINELVGLRMEDELVFRRSHRLVSRLLGSPGIDGVRIDHIDGLADPHGYLDRLAGLGARRIWVEKILAPGETVPSEWPIAGTTGYEFMTDVMRVLNHGSALEQIDRLYRRCVRGAASWADVRHDSRHVVMLTRLSGELFRLAYELDRISEADYHTRDFTTEALRRALGEVIACFVRYRTYLPHDADDAAEVVKTAVYEARRRTPAFEQSIYDFVTDALLGGMAAELEPSRQAWLRRFQQYTAPVAAKGEEDTAFYRYTRFIALNEVGGDPERFADEPEVFHAHAKYRARRFPYSLLATATHDHKRGEDTRMRLLALSERATEWERLRRALHKAVRRHRGDHGPTDSAIHLFLQLLIALWDGSPPDALEQRLTAYMHKAAREAKERTSWLAPSVEYEADIAQFVAGMIGDRAVGRAIAPLAGELARLGFVHGLTQLVLKLTSPGVPDFYQGCELFDLSLVDPDNRRPVDFELRRRLLAELDGLIDRPQASVLGRWAGSSDAKLKLYVTARLLRFRRANPTPFAGGYEALPPIGAAARLLLAYERAGADGSLVVIVPRCATAVVDRSAELAEAGVLVSPGAWTDVLTGQELTIREHEPVTLAGEALPWRVLHRGAVVARPVHSPGVDGQDHGPDHGSREASGNAADGPARNPGDAQRGARASPIAHRSNPPIGGRSRDRDPAGALPAGARTASGPRRGRRARVLSGGARAGRRRGGCVGT